MRDYFEVYTAEEITIRAKLPKPGRVVGNEVDVRRVAKQSPLCQVSALSRAIPAYQG